MNHIFYYVTPLLKCPYYKRGRAAQNAISIVLYKGTCNSAMFRYEVVIEGQNVILTGNFLSQS